MSVISPTVVIGSRVVRTPVGSEWRVGRRWIGRGLPHWRKVWFGKPRAGEAAEAALMLPDVGGLDDLGAAALRPAGLAASCVLAAGAG